MNTDRAPVVMVSSLICWAKIEPRRAIAKMTVSLYWSASAFQPAASMFAAVWVQP